MLPRSLALSALILCASVFGACGSSDGAGQPTDPPGDAASEPDGVDGDASTDADDSGAVDGDVEPDAGDDADPGVPTDPFEHTEVLLSDERVELVDGFSDSLRFTVPEGTHAVMVIVEGEGGTSYTLSNWTDSEGNRLVYPGWVSQEGAGALCLRCTNRVAAADGAFAALAPNNDDAIFVPGEHTIAVHGFRIRGLINVTMASGDAFVTVLAKRLDEPPTSGTLDLNLFFSGVGGWTAESAQTDAEFQRILGEVDRIYGQVGIGLGTLHYFDIDESFAVVEDFTGPDGGLPMLFELSDGAPAAGLNVFFVSELLMGGPLGGFGVILGISGGIPGPALFPGTSRSGVAIAVDAHDAADIDVPLEFTIAHEMGHFLGLFHTSEIQLPFGGEQTHDPIADTPENDPSYLMFNSAAGDRLSEEQGRVMRANHLVRHP